MEKYAKSCAGCRFLAPVYIGDGDELLSACVYILRTGQKRPCPAGPGCTAYQPAEREDYTARPVA